MNYKNVLCASDKHSGHLVGLTPPKYQINDHQAIIWNWYEKKIKEIQTEQPIDWYFDLGDNIDGKGEKSGGTELLTPDINKQIKIACECIDIIQAKKIVMVYGTPYHVGVEMDHEYQIAKEVGAIKIGGHEWVNVNGKIFDLKHFIGNSTVPYSKHTAAAKEALFNDLWSLEGGAPQSDIIIRGHIHKFGYGGDHHKLYLTMPALQSYGSKYGVRKCSGIVNIGIVQFKVYDDGHYDFIWHMFGDIKLIAPKVITENYYDDDEK